MVKSKELAMSIAQSIAPVLGGAIGTIVKEVSDSLNAEHESDLARIKADHEAKIKAITERDAKQLAEANKALDDYIAKSNKSYEEYTEKLAELDKDVEALKASHEAEVAELNKKNEELEKALEAAKAGVPMPTVKVQPKPKPKNAIKHKEFDDILDVVKMQIPVYLNGPAGTGKNVIAEQIASELGVEFYMSAKLNDEYGITGFVDGNGSYIDTPFYNAFTKGGLFLFDEMDASNSQALVAVNSALANGYFVFPKYGKVNAHPDFYVVANGNTKGNGADEQYTGREPLDGATIDRFAFMDVDYDENIELACAGGDKEFVDFIHDLRHAIELTNSKNISVSYRGISYFTKFKAKFSIAKAFKMAIFKGTTRDDMELLEKNLKNKYNKYAKEMSKLVWAISEAA